MSPPPHPIPKIYFSPSSYDSRPVWPHPPIDTTLAPFPPSYCPLESVVYAHHFFLTPRSSLTACLASRPYFRSPSHSHSPPPLCRITVLKIPTFMAPRPPQYIPACSPPQFSVVVTITTLSTWRPAGGRPPTAAISTTTPRPRQPSYHNPRNGFPLLPIPRVPSSGHIIPHPPQLPLYPSTCHTTTSHQRAVVSQLFARPDTSSLPSPTPTFRFTARVFLLPLLFFPLRSLTFRPIFGVAGSLASMAFRP